MDVEAMNKIDFEVFNIVDGLDDKPHWLNIGVAFKNKDDSINIKLKVIPTTGDIQLRELK